MASVALSSLQIPSIPVLAPVSSPQPGRGNPILGKHDWLLVQVLEPPDPLDTIGRRNK